MGRFSRLPALVWGSCPAKPKAPRQDSPAPPGLRGGAVSRLQRSLVPREAQPQLQRPNSPFSAPTDRRRPKHGPYPTQRLGNSDAQICKASPVPALGRLTHPLRHFSFSWPQPALPPPQPLAPTGCRSSSYFRPVPRPGSAAGSGPHPKSFPLEPTYSAKRFRRGSGSSRSLCWGSGHLKHCLSSVSPLYPESDHFASSLLNWQYLNPEASSFLPYFPQQKATERWE